MIGVRPGGAVARNQPLEIQTNESLICRVWDAVVHFFSAIIQFIIESAQNASTHIMNYYSPTASENENENVQPNAPPAALPVQAGTPLAQKLELYRNMPRERNAFFDRAIEIHRLSLQTKEQQGIAALQQELALNAQEMAGYNIPADRRPLFKFDEDFQIIDAGCFPLIGFAISKAYLISNSDTHLNFFSQIARIPGEILPEIRDGNGVIIHNGGQQMEARRINHAERLIELRRIFNALPNAEKELIIDRTDFEGVDNLAISGNGKMILRELGRISNNLIQANPEFGRAIQDAHRRKFPPVN